MNARYTLTHNQSDSNMIYILDRRTGTTHRHDTREFIFGQIMYDHKTDIYPQYIHNAVWGN